MPTKIEGRSSNQDLIDDIVEPSASVSFASNSVSTLIMDGSKTLPNKTFSSYSNIPTLFVNQKTKLDQQDNLALTSELRDRLHLTLPRSSSSSTMMSNDERRKELDLVLKHLYDGKLLTNMNEDRMSSDLTETMMPTLSRAPITTTTSHRNEEENKLSLGNLDLLTHDEDGTSLQRELQEKELDIIHLHKEIQELQLENKLLRAKVPTVYQNGHTSNNTEVEALRREKDVLQNELRIQQDLVSKLQQQQLQTTSTNRSNRNDEVTLHQKEALEKKLRAYEKQMRTLMNDNEQLKQHIQQTDRTISQLKKENEELQLKVNDQKKRNDELLYQEFNALRNDLKMLKQRNDELFEENRHLHQEQQRQQQNLAWRSTLQQAYGNEVVPSSQSNQQQQQQISQMDHHFTSSPQKSSNIDSRRDRSRMMRSDSPNMSENSDSTNYLTTVSVERYNNRPSSSVHRSTTFDGNNHHRTSRYTSLISQDEYQRNNYSKSTKSKRSVEWDEENIQQNEGINHRDMRMYDEQPPPLPPPPSSSSSSGPGRLSRQPSPERSMDHLSHPQSSSSSSRLYQQNYNLSRSITLPETQQQSRRSNSYSIPIRSNNHQENDYQQDDRHQPRHRQPSIDTASPKRPYAPSSIHDIHLNDLIKFSRPGGKISKGIVKYIGSLPGKNDQYLGLELEDEESKHDGVYQGQRLFQCKPNKGVFVGFSKVIMAWSGK